MFNLSCSVAVAKEKLMSAIRRGRSYLSPRKTFLQCGRHLDALKVSLPSSSSSNNHHQINLRRFTAHLRAAAEMLMKPEDDSAPASVQHWDGVQ